MSGKEEDSDRVLRILLAQTEPEDRERLRVAWERYAHGHPESLPALYALADRFSLAAHAALLKRQETLLGAFQEQWGGTSPMAGLNAGGKPGGWITGALCCLAAAIIGAAVARQIPPQPPGEERSGRDD